ncbi:MAG TPA: trigger factor [Terriglobia bacterium]|nr:trigger factor [Terriglobia bacterium]
MEATNCKKELLIEIPVDVVRREAETVTAQYARKARIPGFRPGRAPASLVRRHFRDEIREEVVQALVPKFFEDAVKEQKWTVVGRPRFDDLRFEEDQALACKATFEVLPEIELQQHKGLEVEEETPRVTEADIDKALEEVREQASTFEVVSDRSAADGDYLTVNYSGYDVKTPASHPPQERDVTLELGGRGTPAALAENLRGARPGEIREFEVNYPEDYRRESLAGKTLRYRVEVQSIKHKVVPAADDELAKSVSEFSTLGELRAKLSKDLEERAKHHAEMAAKQELLQHLLRLHEFTVPEAMVEARLDRRLERAMSQLISQGIDPRQAQVDWRKLREDSRADAEREVRSSLLLSKIAEAEGIEVSEEEVDEVIREMAQEAHEPPATLKTRLTREGELDMLKSTRRNQKAIDFIYRNAKITRKSD